MSDKSKTKPTTSLLGMAGFAMVIAACEQASDASGLVEAAEDGSCIVTRLAAASPDNMDAEPCNPCAAACNPCGGCNPCAASCNPCNPCAAKGCNPCGGCNPCAAACNPCNPCAGANPCNPCAAADPCAAANPCNPCAAACNPCGGCNPCNPCGPAGNWDAPEVNADELSAAYDCLKGSMAEHYGMAAEPGAADYQGWRLYNTSPYTSGTHGGRYVNNYSNGVGAREYAKYEDVGTMPVGSILAKDSFTVDAHGNAKVGPLFLMEKMEDGFNAESGNWKYTLINADGTTWGVTNGKNSGGMQFCIDCHLAAEDFDHLFFLPDEYRAE